MFISEILKERGITKAQFAIKARIPQNDFYQASNGKITFFPAWRKREAEVLQMSEEELFPEYYKKEA